MERTTGESDHAEASPDVHNQCQAAVGLDQHLRAAAATRASPIHGACVQHMCAERGCPANVRCGTGCAACDRDSACSSSLACTARDCGWCRWPTCLPTSSAFLVTATVLPPRLLPPPPPPDRERGWLGLPPPRPAGAAAAAVAAAEPRFWRFGGGDGALACPSCRRSTRSTSSLFDLCELRGDSETTGVSGTTHRQQKRPERQPTLRFSWQAHGLHVGGA
jgi:hypothetical protein